MGARKQARQEPAEPSRTAGACVLIVLAAIVVAVVFALSTTVGVLALWAAGGVALWRAARRRVSDSSATPPPRGVTPSGDVVAVERVEIARVVPIAEGVGCILHPVREEEVNET